VTFRRALTDAQWAMVSIAVPKRRGPAPKLDDRTFIDAGLYRAKTGVPWRDLPERFGSWKTVFNRFSNWSQRGHWAAIFKALRIEIDEEGVMIDTSVIRAHQVASAGKGGSSAMHWGVLEQQATCHLPLAAARVHAQERLRASRRAVQRSLARPLCCVPKVVMHLGFTHVARGRCRSSRTGGV